MLAAFAHGISRDDPMSALTIGRIEAPEVPQDWVAVQVKAASLNHHDLWALKGQALTAERLPMILGTDAAGITADGREVIVHAVIGDPGPRGDETLDPKRSLLSEVYPGALAQVVRVPARNLIDKPASLTFEEAACLPTAWLTAYRMIETKSGTGAGDTILVQGAAGGVATALIVLGKALGRQVWVTSRTPDKRDWALTIGADAAFEPGARLPAKVDAVMETVGEATWDHSMKSLRPGGRIVISGATSGANPPADLNRLFFLQLSVVGSTMGTREELIALVDLLDRTGVRPVIDRAWPLADGAEAFAALLGGDVHGKLVLTVD
ncbi:MAG: zinc-binding dehydrogenase [Actinomycetales bacterium]|nr:zinc-binding dehydrogenase [Actinomycetales bacterium]